MKCGFQICPHFLIYSFYKKNLIILAKVTTTTTTTTFNGSKCLSAVRGFIIVVSQVRWVSYADIDTRRSAQTEAFGRLFIPQKSFEKAPKSSVKL